MVRRIRHNKKNGGGTRDEDARPGNQGNRSGNRAARADTSGGGRMDRLQFYLEPSLHRELDRLAAECNVSKAELIRDGIRYIVRERRDAETDPLMQLAGRGSSGKGDVSEKHDDYIYRP